MTIFFINSPAQIIHRVLPLMNEKKFKDLTIVMPEELAPFFKEHTDVKVVVPTVHPNLITRKTKYKFLANAIRSKLEYRRLFKDIKNEEIYLFFFSWGVVYQSYVAKLSGRNKVYLYTVEDEADSLHKEEKSIRAFFMRLTAKILLGVDVCILNKSNLPVWELKRDSFPMEIVMYDKFDEKIPEQFSLDDKLLEGKKLLFVGDDIDSEGADKDEIIELTNHLMDILDDRFSDCYIIKPHPREQILYGRMSEATSIISPYMMAETLMRHDWDYIIGYYSEALLSAKLYTNAKVISLLQLWKWNNLKFKDYWYKRFRKGGVLMPESLDDLKEILQRKRLPDG